MLCVRHGSGARLQPGSTYVNKGYMLTSNLGSVEATASALVDRTFVDEIGLELVSDEEIPTLTSQTVKCFTVTVLTALCYTATPQWSPRAVHVYTKGAGFVVLAAPEPGAATTSCAAADATLACAGYSTPQAGAVPFFYVTCGAATYFGPDPYRLAPSFGADGFPGHGDGDHPVRPYLCNGEMNSIRPAWTLMGFFDASDAGCAALAGAVYADATCVAAPASAAPSVAPSSIPTSASAGAVRIFGLRISSLLEHAAIDTHLKHI